MFAGSARGRRGIQRWRFSRVERVEGEGESVI